eukprot:2541168-Lingulodinium_polyedra.AAC.1
MAQNGWRRTSSSNLRAQLPRTRPQSACTARGSTPIWLNNATASPSRWGPCPPKQPLNARPTALRLA